MPVPLIAAAAAAAAARIAAKKIAQRAVGGITGAGAKSINKGSYKISKRYYET